MSFQNESFNNTDVLTDCTYYYYSVYEEYQCSTATVIWVSIIVAITVLYLLWYYKVVVRHPLLYGGKDGLKEYLMNTCPILSQPYRPTIWAWHYHVQTLLGLYTSQLLPIEYKREMIQLEDGGTIALDWSLNTTNGNTKPILLIIPGFTGDSRDPYVSQIVHYAHLNGYQCAVYIKQGLGNVPISSPRLFTFSNVKDLEAILNTIQKRCPPMILAIAVSFGGITLTHYLHATGNNSLISGALIFSMPWKVKATANCFDTKLDNIILYRRYTMNILKKRIKDNSEVLKQNPKVNIDKVLKAKTLQEFDAFLTVPTYNLSSSEESQKNGDADTSLSGIKVPFVVVTSSDDPLVPLQSIPISEFETNPNTVLLLTKHGGHFGFLEGLLPRNRSWMNKVFCQFIATMKTKSV